MTELKDIARALSEAAHLNPEDLKNTGVAHLFVHRNKVITSRALPGLKVDVKELAKGVSVKLRLKDDVVLEHPVQVCFGLLPKTGVQQIIMDVNIGKRARISIFAHCVFPQAVNVKHIMDARIRLGEEAEYNYFEKHVHGPHGGIKVYPKARVELARGARFKTEFELLTGRVGLIEIDYDTVCRAESVMEMNARINAREDDVVKIRESGHLIGDHARGVLTSRVALRERARGEIYNVLTATAPYARGHVDCKEIVQGNAVAKATPIVEVRHPQAHITHEAAIGSVDSKQLETLMSRGLSEEEAVELIIKGLLS
jgi:Fe-S cluster assembly scaffold protein SufB